MSDNAGSPHSLTPSLPHSFTRAGRVTLVGAGPGDPGLLTLRGRDALARAEVVVYDHLASPRLLTSPPPGPPRTPAAKPTAPCTPSQGETNAVRSEHARPGRRVARPRG